MLPWVSFVCGCAGAALHACWGLQRGAHQNRLAKGISAGLWVDLEAAWVCASGRLAAPTCKRVWGASGDKERDFMVGCPLAAAAVLSCKVESGRRILLLGLSLTAVGGPVGLRNPCSALPSFLLLGCLLLIRIGVQVGRGSKCLGDI